MKVSGIVVAAGSGKRFGTKKQFAKIKNRWVLEYSVDVLKKICSNIVIVTQEEDMDKIKEKFNFAIVVEGGKERMYSVYNGLSYAYSDIVIIHDAARPIINEKFVQNILDIAQKKGSAVPVLNISETVKKIEKDKIVATIDRNGLYVAQTPQAFNCNQLKAAYNKAIKSEKNYTDESGVWEEFYGSACYVEGSSKNIKITFREDLEIAECLLG